MGKFIVSEEFWELFPEAEIAVVSAKGINSREAFKTKQNTPYPAEDLLRSVANGMEVRKIDPLIDIYNSVSMTYGLPSRNEDIATFKGDMAFRKAKGGKSYIALGDSEYDNALPGEIAFIDDEGDICRCWNWRDGQRTIQTEDTADAFLIIESVDPNRSSDLKEAAEELARLIKKYLNGTTEIFYMNCKNKELKL